MKHDDLLVEYNNIKQEIFTMMNRMDQMIVLQYTVSVAFLAAAIQFDNNGIIILNLLFVVAIQELVNTRRRHLARSTVYIQKNIETNIEDLNWETQVEKIDERYRDKYLYNNEIKKIYYFLTNNGALVIAFISVVLYYHTNKIFGVGELFLWLLLVVSIRQSTFYSNFRKIKNDYSDIINGLSESSKIDA